MVEVGVMAEEGMKAGMHIGRIKNIEATEKQPPSHPLANLVELCELAEPDPGWDRDGQHGRIVLCAVGRLRLDVERVGLEQSAGGKPRQHDQSSDGHESRQTDL